MCVKRGTLTEIPKLRLKLTVQRAKLVPHSFMLGVRLVVQSFPIAPEREKYAERDSENVHNHKHDCERLKRGVAAGVAGHIQIPHQHGPGHALNAAATKDGKDPRGKPGVHELHHKDEDFHCELSPGLSKTAARVSRIDRGRIHAARQLGRHGVGRAHRHREQRHEQHVQEKRFERKQRQMAAADGKGRENVQRERKTDRHGKHFEMLGPGHAVKGVWRRRQQLSKQNEDFDLADQFLRRHLFVLFARRAFDKDQHHYCEKDRTGQCEGEECRPKRRTARARLAHI